VLQEAAGRLEAFLSEAEHAEKSDIAIRARATVAEEKVQEEKKKSLISEEGRETDHGKPEIRIEEQAGGAHELPAPAAESSAGTVEQAAGGHERPASAVEPVAGMREQPAGVHEPSGKKKGKKGKKSKKGGKK
jgi:hypothetical protein